MGWKLCNEKPDVFLLMIGRFLYPLVFFLFYLPPKCICHNEEVANWCNIYTLFFFFSPLELCNFLVSIGVRLIFFSLCRRRQDLANIWPLSSAYPPSNTPPSTRALYPISKVRNVVVLCEWMMCDECSLQSVLKTKKIIVEKMVNPDKSKMLFVVYLKQALLQSSKATRARSYHQVCSWIYPVKHPVRKWTNQNDQMKYYWKKKSENQ